jgi:hypothetical protein
MIKELREKAQQRRSFTFSPGTEDELTLRLRAVKFEDILRELGTVNPEEFREVSLGSDSGNSLYDTLNGFASNPDGMSTQIQAGRKMQQAYLVLGVEGPVKIAFDDDPASEALAVSELYALYDEQVDDLVRRIKVLSGVFEKSKSR